MIFSLEFVVVFLAFVLIYNQLNQNAQNIALLLFNLAFVGFCGLYFLTIIIIYAVFVHFLALLLYVRDSKNIFYASLLSCVMFLCCFKYFAFLKAQAFSVFLFLGFGADFELVFALGLSFYVFASLSYLSFIYQRKSPPASFCSLLTYLSFFATFIAGPIFRYEKFIQAYKRKKRFYHANLIIILILLALAKKLAIAPALYEILNAPLESNSPSFLALFNSCLFYSFYLYADFSAYSDIVTALALTLGIRLPRNFAHPLSACSVADFWHRWHISLSRFIRDFIYIPLGGSRNGWARYLLATLIAFILSGIWHGAGAHFAIWGFAHAIGLIFFRFYCKFIKHKMPRFFAAILCFIYISLCWAFFHLNLDELGNILKLAQSNNTQKDYLELILAFGIFVFLYLFRGKVYIFRKVFNSHILGLITCFIWLYIVLYFMPNGVPNFIYAGF